MAKRTITRRELLKAALAAGTGLTAAAFLPEKWLKPVVQSGVLPAHAQASSSCGIFSLKIYDNGDGGIKFIVRIKPAPSTNTLVTYTILTTSLGGSVLKDPVASDGYMLGGSGELEFTPWKVPYIEGGMYDIRLETGMCVTYFYNVVVTPS